MIEHRLVDHHFWCCVDVLFLNVVCGMYVWCSLCVSGCMLTVSIALFMSTV